MNEEPDDGKLRGLADADLVRRRRSLFAALCVPALALGGWLALHTLLATATLQFALGVSTLLLVVPIPLAAAHQAGAVLLLTAAIVLRHALRHHT